MESHFSTNIIKAEGGQLIKISKSIVTVVKSNFNDNNAYGGDPVLLGVHLIVVYLTNKVNFRNTKLFYNVVISVLLMGSKIRNMNSFL